MTTPHLERCLNCGLRQLAQIGERIWACNSCGWHCRGTADKLPIRPRASQAERQGVIYKKPEPVKPDPATVEYKPVGGRMQSIIETVAREFQIDTSEIYARGRNKRVVLARYLIVLLARHLTTHSYPEIANAMHLGNHSTSITQMKRVKQRLKHKPDAGMMHDPVLAAMPDATIEELAIRLYLKLKPDATQMPVFGKVKEGSKE